jgi:hypothetical protein
MHIEFRKSGDAIMMKPDSNSTKRALPLAKKSPSPLSEILNRRLNAYAMAAAASGVAVLACAAPAEGQPVCKAVSIDLSSRSTYPLNPAHQFAAPFNVAQSVYTNYFSTTGVSQFFWWNRAFFTPNSAGAQVLLGSNNLPADLAFGAEVGPGGQFGKGSSYGLLFTYGRGTYGGVGGGTKNQHRGNLSLTKNGYVGFQFAQSGETYYGWARLAVTFKQGYFNKNYTSIHVMSFGYESTPNTGITAGNCKTGEQATTAASLENSLATQPGSLGMLALGSEGLANWRK